MAHSWYGDKRDESEQLSIEKHKKTHYLKDVPEQFKIR